MTYVIKFGEEVVGRIMSNHGMTDEEICETAGIELATTEDEYMNAPENGMYDIDSLEIVSC